MIKFKENKLIKKIIISTLVLMTMFAVVAPVANTQTVAASVTSNKKAVDTLAKKKYHWNKTQIKYLHKVIKYESGWKLNARNGQYYGLFQTTNVRDKSAKGQAKQGLKYIHSRYGKPSGAWAHIKSYRWY
ncbi:hypothetical protein EFS54_07860 [Periweissella beninensis]|uniref:Transglycosylase n=2 Tax=Periweissella beninensis TaxID=504936 RepID=A0ABT0VH11_9LACO|nr:hypothetical protein [Periweissella beninensis]MCT4396903.1 hypothetical protein [Periweissella beninensis]